MPARNSPVWGLVGLLMTLGGAVIVFSTYALERGDPQSTRNVAVGVALTLVGWLVQRLANRPRARS